MKIVSVISTSTSTSTALFYFKKLEIFKSDMISAGVQQHYENTPVQHTAIFHGCKNDNFHVKYFSHFCSTHRLCVLIRTATIYVFEQK